MEQLIILTDKDEIEAVIGDDLTNEEWLEIKKEINGDTNMWEVVDECIRIVIDEFLEKKEADTNG